MGAGRRRGWLERICAPSPGQLHGAWRRQHSDRRHLGALAPATLLPGGHRQRWPVVPIYLLHVTALSVAICWLYWKTEGSLLLVMLMHASVNNTTGIVPAAVPNAVDAMSFNGSLVAWATVGVSSVVSALLLIRMRGAATPGAPRDEHHDSMLEEPRDEVAETNVEAFHTPLEARLVDALRE